VKVEITAAYMVCEVTMMWILESHSSGTPFFFYLVEVDCSKAAALAFMIDQSIVTVFRIAKINPFPARLALFLPITSTNPSRSIGNEFAQSIRAHNIIAGIHLEVFHVIRTRHSRLGTVYKHRVIGHVLMRYVH
jgi:hypothetical protein